MPITSVRSPDGAIIKVNHPEGASQDQIINYAKSNYKAPQPAAQPQADPYAKFTQDRDPLLRTVGNLASNLAGNIRTSRDIQSSDYNPASKGFQQFTRVGLKSMGDIIGAGVGGAVSLGRAITDIPPAAVASMATGVPFQEVYRQARQDLGPMGRTIGGAASETLGPVYQANEDILSGIEETNPELAGNLRGAEYLAGAALGGTGGSAAKQAGKKSLETTRPGFFGQAADLIKLGETRDRSIKDMLTPTGPKAEAEFAARGKDVKGIGPFKTSEKRYTPYEQARLDTFINLKGADPRKGPQGMINLADKAGAAEKATLEKSLGGYKGKWDGSLFTNKIQNDVNKIYKTMTATGNKIPKEVNDQFTELQKALNEIGVDTPLGAHKVRQAFDDWRTGYKPTSWSTPEARNAFKDVHDTIRKSMNESIESQTSGLGYQKSLTKQHHLIMGKKILADKAAKVPETIMSRFEKRKNQLADMNTATAAAAAVKDVGMATAKATIEPLLNTVDTLLQVASPDQLKPLRAYRNGLLDYMRTLPGDDEEEKRPLSEP